MPETSIGTSAARSPVGMIVLLEAYPVSADAPELRASLTEANLPTEDLTDGGRSFFRFEQSGVPVGYGGYELYGDDALLRSVVVLPQMRGKGYGRAVTEALMAAAGATGARTAYLAARTGILPWVGAAQHRTTPPCVCSASGMAVSTGRRAGDAPPAASFRAQAVTEILRDGALAQF